MKKVDKHELAQALMSLYESTKEFNRIGGKNISPEFEDSQKGVIQEEFIEKVNAFVVKDGKEKIDALVDLLVTSSFMVMIQDGNDNICKEHTGYFHADGKSEEVLAGTLYTAVLKEKWIDVLEITEDLLYLIDPSAIYNVYQVRDSNMSKFVPVTSLDNPEEMCDTIEGEGRYTGVEYHTEQLSSGQEVYVFTATYDVKSKTAFDKPKIVKPTGFFKEPELIVE